MSTRVRLRPPVLVLLLILLGCRETGSTPPAAAPAKTQLPASPESNRIVKIAVLVDGTVLVNSEPVPIDSFGDKLDAITNIEAFWYHRENPQAGEPHENAMKVIAELVNRKLPVAMYLDREFTQRLELGGQ